MTQSPFPTYPDPAALHAYTSGKRTFIEGFAPSAAVALPDRAVLDWLEDRLGKATLTRCLQYGHREPSPRADEPDSSWLQRSNMVGINVRTLGDFFGVVKYALTMPAAQDSLHLLPIWEPGVVASLYGMVSWEINPEFFSQALYRLYPHLDTVEIQLSAVVNLLHAMGKSVGMDVIPHVDRYAEIVLVQPAYFEWLQRDDLRIVAHHERLYQAVEVAIVDWLRANPPAENRYALPKSAEDFFGGSYPEPLRRTLLFGMRRDYGERRERRVALMDHLYRLGLEPVPATMAPPYRGLEVDPSPAALTVDADGREWRDYRITQPTEMSRVFGPLARYQLYGRKDNNQNWEIDFDHPRPEVWQYVQRKYDEAQYRYGFDFMRGDMSHVQMRPAGVPERTDAYYDIHRAVKRTIQRVKPYFGYYAESFLAPPDYMTYGDEIAHLIASEADTALGNLQSSVVGSAEFLTDLAHYVQIAERTPVKPTFTVMTADKDDPRFDAFYLAGNEVRLFTALFLTALPSYVGAGFLQRDAHPTPAPNEHYTKLFVFQIDEGPKATAGPYVWGRNRALFERLDRIRSRAEELLPQLDPTAFQWLLRPNSAADYTNIAWTHTGSPYAFWVNLTDAPIATRPPALDAYPDRIFSTTGAEDTHGERGLGAYEAVILKQ